MNQEKLKGGECTRNCPLIATLKMFFSSACSANKRSVAKDDSGWEKEDSGSGSDD